jgi:hypothetical protein
MSTHIQYAHLHVRVAVFFIDSRRGRSSTRPLLLASALTACFAAVRLRARLELVSTADVEPATVQSHPSLPLIGGPDPASLWLVFQALVLGLQLVEQIQLFRCPFDGRRCTCCFGLGSALPLLAGQRRTCSRRRSRCCVGSRGSRSRSCGCWQHRKKETCHCSARGNRTNG